MARSCGRPEAPFLEVRPADTLRRRRDFQRVFREGKTVVHRLMVLHWVPGEGSSSRVGFLVSRRVGSAVVRNRVKRRMKEACRLLQDRLPPGIDLVFVGRQALFAAPWEEVLAAMTFLLDRAGK